MSKIRFAPNFYHLFLELPARERFAAAAKLGFDAIEWHLPYEIPKAELKTLLADNGLRLTYAIIPRNNSIGGLGGQPGHEDEFRRAADLALDYAFDVGFDSIQIGHGAIPDGYNREQCTEVYVKNIQYVCDQAKGTNLAVVIEPVTTVIRKREYVMSKMHHGADVVRRAERPNLKLVYDTYHLRMEETGALTDILDEYWPMIGYVQIGNAPTRHEPGEGEIDLHDIIGKVYAKGYQGWIGLEYDPAHGSWKSLAWVQRYGYPTVPR